MIAKKLHFEQIDSTNTWAKAHPEEWSPSGVTLITASAQSAGRGRFKRQWISPPNLNIYCTFCFWIDSQRNDLGHIPQLLALTTTQMLEMQGFFPKIKWPNDILIQGKKIGGILCETILDQNKRGVVCGIGLNVNMPLEILNQIDRPATSLLVETERQFDVSVILELLQFHYLAALNDFFLNGFSQFFSAFQERSAFKQGQNIQFHDNLNVIKGEFERLNLDGSIELRLPCGSLRTFYAGEFL